MKEESTVHLEPTVSVDMRDQKCPLPVLRAKLMLTRVRVGEIVHVAATDPHATVDFRAFCARTGHELAQHVQDQEGVLHFYIRRVSGAHT
jgi:tRNA 2-thiouridine synthesizing protein A